MQNLPDRLVESASCFPSGDQLRSDEMLSDVSGVMLRFFRVLRSSR